MPTYGPNSVASGANIAGSNTDWTNPGNVVSSNNSYASCGTLSPGSPTDYLAATNPGFSIPGTDTIDGIEVNVEASRSSGTANITAIALTKNGSSALGNKTPAQALTGTDVVYTFGGPADLWGQSWTPAEINASTFGAMVVCLGTPPSGGAPRIDHITITVYTTAGGGTPTKIYQHRLRRAG